MKVPAEDMIGVESWPVAFCIITGPGYAGDAMEPFMFWRRV